MEPNNLENQIREKLESREIQPSLNAWDRLDAMLSITEEKKIKRSFGWFYIAASILVFVSLGMYFFNQDGTKINPTETVVGIEKNNNNVHQNTNAIAEKEIENSVPNSEALTSNQKDNIKSVTPTNSKSVIAQNEPSFTRSKAEQSAANQKTSSTSLINKEKVIEFQNSNDVALKNLPKIETRNEILVSNFNKELLLVNEEKKLNSDKSPKIKVNAKSLLTQVDSELEFTFREKIFNKAVKNYKEVKVALANRNQEQ